MLDRFSTSRSNDPISNVLDDRRGPAIDAELSLSSWRQATLRVGGRTCAGRPELGPATRRRLRSAALDPETYGTLLFEGLFPAGSHLLAGYRDALAVAEHSGRRLRLRLHIPTGAPRALHALRWELLYDPLRRMAIGRSREVVFSRDLGIRSEASNTWIKRPRILVAAAAPSDLGAFGLAELDRDAIQSSLAEVLDPLSDELDWEMLEGPVTAGRLRERLVGGGFHALHLHAHGVLDPDGGGVSLVLEDTAGRATFVPTAIFSQIFDGVRDLRLVTLLACHSGFSPGEGSFGGLAPELIERGIPAVLAMRRAIQVTAAARLARTLYRNLARDGRIDGAVNEARQQLYLEAPERADWETPALYMQLHGGRLWERRRQTRGVATDRTSQRRSQAEQRGGSAWAAVAALAGLGLLAVAGAAEPPPRPLHKDAGGAAHPAKSIAAVHAVQRQKTAQVPVRRADV